MDEDDEEEVVDEVELVEEVVAFAVFPAAHAPAKPVVPVPTASVLVHPPAIAQAPLEVTALPAVFPPKIVLPFAEAAPTA